VKECDGEHIKVQVERVPCSLAEERTYRKQTKRHGKQIDPEFDLDDVSAQEALVNTNDKHATAIKTANTDHSNRSQAKVRTGSISVAQHVDRGTNAVPVGRGAIELSGD
jgi:hypothetical protein